MWMLSTTRLSLFPGEDRTYTSTDTIVDTDDPEAAMSQYPVEFLHALKVSGMPAHTLTTKVGMPLILLRNIAPKNGLCNGTKVYVVAHYYRILLVKRYDSDVPFIIPRIHIYSDDKDFPFKLRRTQIPARPAFAMTIHKAQGETLDHVSVYLKSPVFGHGQLYVALSRVTIPANLKIAIPINREQSTQVTKNIVYTEVCL